MNRTRAAVPLVVLASALAVVACGSSGGTSSKQVKLVAYSTPQAAYGALIKGFAATPGGKGVSFTQSYGPSGDQSRAVASGLPASVVNLSLEPDVARLVGAGVVGSNWNRNPTKGNVSNSVAVIIVRQGNPKHITGWDDLVKPGVAVLTPNPLRSGSARWNIAAAYGAEIKEGKTPAQARAYLTALFHNVASQDTSARNALHTFTAGKGDALIDYETEAIADIAKGAAIDYVIPRQTILIQNPIAITSTGDTPATRAFVAYLFSPAGQTIWAANGYRPVTSGVVAARRFPVVPGLFTIDALGGWPAVTKEFFDPAVGIVTKIEQSLGVSTTK